MKFALFFAIAQMLFACVSAQELSLDQIEYLSSKCETNLSIFKRFNIDLGSESAKLVIGLSLDTEDEEKKVTNHCRKQINIARGLVALTIILILLVVIASATLIVVFVICRNK